MNHSRTAGIAVAVTISLALAGSVAAQAPASPAGPAAEVQRAYAGLKANILKAAEEMPAGGFYYKPTPEIRTFARVVNHISEAQLRSCGAVDGVDQSALPKVPPETA